MTDIQHFGTAMANRRGRLSRRQVAEATGIPESTLASWESGKTIPPADKLMKLCDLYGCSMDALVGRA